MLDCWGLDAQQKMFKLCMKNNSKATMESFFDLNLLIHIWRTIYAFWVFTHSFHEYLKLTKMGIVHVLEIVKHEWLFSSLAFFKSQLQITLDLHLALMVGMYNQKLFLLESFPYVATFDAWIGLVDHYGVLAWLRFL